VAEGNRRRNSAGQAILAGICMVLIFLHLLPLNTVPANWAPPDLILAVTLVWVTRRPEYAPAPLIAVIFLLADFLFGRPPGLMTALVVILTEMLRSRSKSLRTVPFPVEWISVSVGIIGIALANRLVLAVVLVPAPSLSLTLIQALLTALAYPLVVFLAYVIFGVSRPAPGEVDALGQRL
jgi:rod shape-determining protein MreD